MFNQLITFLLLITFSFNSLAGTIGNAKDISEIMIKYDYLLSSHPNAHEKDFQKTTLENFKKDLQAAVSTTDKNELEKSFQEVVKNIPSKEKRDAYLKVLRNSSQSQVAAMLANPDILKSSLRGESANFFLGSDAPLGLNIAVTLVAGLILYAIISAVVFSIKYETFNSYQVRTGECTYSSLEYNASSSTISDMKEDARRDCKNGAKNPSTCEPNGWDYSESTEYSQSYPHETYTECYISYEYKAKKKL